MCCCFTAEEKSRQHLRYIEQWMIVRFITTTFSRMPPSWATPARSDTARGTFLNIAVDLLPQHICHIIAGAQRCCCVNCIQRIGSPGIQPTTQPLVSHFRRQILRGDQTLSGNHEFFAA